MIFPESNKYLANPCPNQSSDQDAEAIFMIRTFSLFFRQNFNRAFNSEVADFINILFDTNYKKNEISKLTEDIKKSENNKNRI